MPGCGTQVQSYMRVSHQGLHGHGPRQAQHYCNLGLRGICPRRSSQHRIQLVAPGSSTHPPHNPARFAPEDGDDLGEDDDDDVALRLDLFEPPCFLSSRFEASVSYLLLPACFPIVELFEALIFCASHAVFVLCIAHLSRMICVPL